MYMYGSATALTSSILSVSLSIYLYVFSISSPSLLHDIFYHFNALFDTCLEGLSAGSEASVPVLDQLNIVPDLSDITFLCDDTLGKEHIQVLQTLDRFVVCSLETAVIFGDVILALHEQLLYSLKLSTCVFLSAWSSVSSFCYQMHIF